MIRLILLVAIILSLIIVYRQFKATPTQHRNKFLIKLAITTSVTLVILLALTGRIHWIGGLIAVSIPIIRSLLPLFIAYLPQFKRRQAGQQNPPTSSANLSLKDAYNILGLQADASKAEVINAHRLLIQKLHPDRGGNDYLAAQINLAKDILLKHLDKA